MGYSKPYISYKNGKQVWVLSASCDRCGMFCMAAAINFGQKLPDIDSAVYCELCVPPVAQAPGV